jgi:hypothetical protein
VSSLLAAVVITATIVGTLVWAASRIVSAIEKARADAARGRTLQLMALFSPGLAAPRDDPRTLLAWQPLAGAARQLFADEFAALDRASGTTFPFSPDDIQAAHARWTADWLAWESGHDTEYKLKAAAIEAELTSGGSALNRARLAAVEREKIERYQRRYEDYTRVSKALHALMTRP